MKTKHSLAASLVLLPVLLALNASVMSPHRRMPAPVMPSLTWCAS